MSLSFVTTEFLSGFEKFDRFCVYATLRSVSGDLTLVDQAQRRLGLHAPLTLIKRLAIGRAVDDACLALIDRVIARSGSLQQKYIEITQQSVASGMHGPDKELAWGGNRQSK